MKLQFLDKDGIVVKSVNVTKAVKINTDSPRFYLEEIKDGDFKLMWSSGFLDEFKDVENIEVVRND